MFSIKSTTIQLLCLTISLSLANAASAQSLIYCNQASSLIKTAEKFHYNPRAVDDQLSNIVFDQTLKYIDPSGFYFSKEDIESISGHRNSIDDELTSLNCTFLSDVNALYLKKLDVASALVDELEKQTIELKSEDSLVSEINPSVHSNSELPLYWKRVLKMQILSTYFGKADLNKAVPYPSAEEIKSIKSEILEHYRCRIQARKNPVRGTEVFIGERFMKALAYSYDPHTSYFGIEDKSSYDVHLQKESRSYGLEIEQNESGYMEIIYITPGSPAWNSNELNEGDVIVNIDSDNGRNIDLECSTMAEANNFLFSPEIDKAVFTIRKQNGKEIKIDLYKDEFNVEENVITSFILDGPKKVGYIYLPAFYSQQEGRQLIPNGCANDVAKEIIQLKREGIEGIVLDLRDNGGGSMQEAIRMAGIFINYGALSILETRGVDPLTLKDMDRGTVFDQPLVVMVNKFSASASELFAAAMQDYNRGVIVGSNTFGKSTAQQILPLDLYRYNSIDEYKGEPKAYVKLTEGAFYRFNGNTHQKEGVVPDIRIPDPYDRKELGESRFETALELKPIVKKTYAYPLDPLPIETLKKSSELRQSKIPFFREMEIQRQEPLSYSKKFSIPLDFEGFRKIWTDEFTEEGVELDKNLLVFSLKIPSYREGIEASETEKELNQLIFEDIENDWYIDEAYRITIDLINSN